MSKTKKGEKKCNQYLYQYISFEQPQLDIYAYIRNDKLHFYKPCPTLYDLIMSIQMSVLLVLCVISLLLIHYFSANKDFITDTPFECAATKKCDDLIAGWTVGNNGFCFGEDYGARLGKGGYVAIFLQVETDNKTQDMFL